MLYRAELHILVYIWSTAQNHSELSTTIYMIIYKFTNVTGN